MTTREDFLAAHAALAEAEMGAAQKLLDMLNGKVGTGFIDTLTALEGDIMPGSDIEKLCLSILQCVHALRDTATRATTPLSPPVAP